MTNGRIKSDTGRRRDADVEFILAPRPRRGKPRKPGPPGKAPQGRVPRIARLMALAIKFDGMIRDRQVQDYAELSRLGLVTRARMTQIMNLLNLAPDIQEEILFLPENVGGSDAITERECRRLTAVVRWDRQRAMWGGSTAVGETNPPWKDRRPMSSSPDSVQPV